MSDTFWIVQTVTQQPASLVGVLPLPLQAEVVGVLPLVGHSRVRVVVSPRAAALEILLLKENSNAAARVVNLDCPPVFRAYVVENCAKPAVNKNCVAR